MRSASAVIISCIEAIVHLPQILTYIIYVVVKKEWGHKGSTISVAVAAAAVGEKVHLGMKQR